MQTHSCRPSEPNRPTGGDTDQRVQLYAAVRRAARTRPGRPRQLAPFAASLLVGSHGTAATALAVLLTGLVAPAAHAVQTATIPPVGAQGSAALALAGDTTGTWLPA